MEIATKGWFEGAWSIERVIDDRQAGRPARLSGTASFVADGTALDYWESGMLGLEGHKFPAERRYRWLFAPEGLIRVAFEDGRPFHAFLRHCPVAQHLCGEDRYSVAYVFETGQWHSHWKVTGPAKDYSIGTSYSRL